MIPPTWTDEEHAAFWTGFDLAQPPGRQELDALDSANEVLPVDGGQLRVAVSGEIVKAILAETDRLPENLSGPTWLGFLRGMIAQARVESGGPGYVHEGGRA